MQWWFEIIGLKNDNMAVNSKKKKKISETKINHQAFFFFFYHAEAD